MTEEELKNGISQLLLSSRSLEAKIDRKLENADRDIAVLFESRNEQNGLLKQIEKSIEHLNQARIESRDDIKEANKRYDNLHEDIMSALHLAMETKNQACKEIHRKLETEIDVKLTEVQLSHAEKFSSFKREEALTVDNKVSNYKMYIAYGGWSLLLMTTIFIIGKMVTK